MKKNYLYFVVGIIIIIALLFKAFSSVNFSSSPKLSENVVLSLETEKSLLKVKDEFILTINLDSQNSEVAAADFVLNYDPQFLKVKALERGGFFSNYPVKKIEKNNFKISGVAAYDGESLILPKGNNSIAIATFQALKKGKTIINFDSKKTIVATDGQNILAKKKLPEVVLTIE